MPLIPFYKSPVHPYQLENIDRFYFDTDKKELVITYNNGHYYARYRLEIPEHRKWYEFWKE